MSANCLLVSVHGEIIMEASSAEELSGMLNVCLSGGQNRWEVIPLQTLMSGIEDAKRQTENIKKMADMASAIRQR